MTDFGTSQSPKSTRPLTTYLCPSRPGHQALRNNFASSLLLRTWLPYDWTPRSEAYFVFPLAQGTPGKQCGLAATGDYPPSLRSPWLAACTSCCCSVIAEDTYHLSNTVRLFGSSSSLNLVSPLKTVIEPPPFYPGGVSYLYSNQAITCFIAPIQSVPAAALGHPPASDRPPVARPYRRNNPGRPGCWRWARVCR